MAVYKAIVRLVLLIILSSFSLGISAQLVDKPIEFKGKKENRIAQKGKFITIQRMKKVMVNDPEALALHKEAAKMTAPIMFTAVFSGICLGWGLGSEDPITKVSLLSLSALSYVASIKITSRRTKKFISAAKLYNENLKKRGLLSRLDLSISNTGLGIMLSL